MDVGAGGVEGDLHTIRLHMRQQAVHAFGGGLETELAGPSEPSEVGSMPTIHTGSSTGLRLSL